MRRGRGQGQDEKRRETKKREERDERRERIGRKERLERVRKSVRVSVREKLLRLLRKRRPPAGDKVEERKRREG